MGRVDLHTVEARGQGTVRRPGECLDHVADPALVEGAGGRIPRGEGDGRGREGLPPAFLGAGASRAGLPSGRGGALAARVVELDEGACAAGVDHLGQACEGRDLGVVVQAQAVHGDAPLGGDTGGLDDDRPDAAPGALAVVDEVPVGGATHLGPQGPGGVLAHGWHPHAVGDLQGSDGDGFEETRAGHGARLRPPPRPHPARNRAPHLPAAGRPHPPPAAPAALVSRGTD